MARGRPRFERPPDGSAFSGASGSAYPANGSFYTTARPPPLRRPTLNRQLTRGKTLVRPERQVEPVPLLNPQTQLARLNPSRAAALIGTQRQGRWTPWTVFARLVTFWTPGFILGWCGVRDRQSQQAWREKVTLCLIALLMGSIVVFLTLGMNRLLCPADQGTSPENFIEYDSDSVTLGILGWQYNITQASLPSPGPNFFQLAADNSGADITNYFYRDQSQYTACTSTLAYATQPVCFSNNTFLGCPLARLGKNTTDALHLVNITKQVGYQWSQVGSLDQYMVLDGNVLNLAPYIAALPNPIPGDIVDGAIRQVLALPGGKDGTRLFYNRAALQSAIPCLTQKYYAGHIDKDTPGCFASQLFLYLMLIAILGLVLTRFAMACVFNWFISHRLVKPPKTDKLARQVISPSVMPPGANSKVDNKNGTAPWSSKQRRGGVLSLPPPSRQQNSAGAGAGAVASEPLPTIQMSEIGAELFCVCLVTCYSEGEEGIRTTLSSLAGTTYSDHRKLLFVVADGMITGSGEKRSTPDICVGLIEPDSRFGNPQPMSYSAVASGRKQHNMAMVYAGHYLHAKGNRTPIVVVVKCGTPAEAGEKKPGNRGKRDSQLILMNYFSRVTYNERMTPLDYDLFRKMHALMGVTPDYFEICLMVDADTKVYKDSLKQLVNCMQHDNLIMGVCGETRIMNKRQSWVTAIQVFEYYISHHLSKGFESVFGGVTCLPGCFSMYRLKARRKTDDDWVPIITKPEIIREYSQTTVTTLHQKNLLLLGEDRFLTTTMLRTFPNRKMMFCPQAICKTVVPDTFSVLLSQRRRWINSTIHNLMELVRVRNLCGTFCFSMQFVVFMELVGTVVLPVAICLTYYLIVNVILKPPQRFADWIPLILLITVLGLPAILVLLTTRKVVYIAWMLVYLIALPVWNFLLPVYAFWHFDDFSWGETRKVVGDIKGSGHGDGEGVFDQNSVSMRRWEDWERSRLRKERREERRRIEMEQARAQHQAQSHGFPANPHDPNGLLSPRPVQKGFAPDARAQAAQSERSRDPMVHQQRPTQFPPSPNASDGDDHHSHGSSHDHDPWVAQIGNYDDEAETGPPPVGLYDIHNRHSIQNAPVLGARELEQLLGVPSPSPSPKSIMDESGRDGYFAHPAPVRPNPARLGSRANMTVQDGPQGPPPRMATLPPAQPRQGQPPTAMTMPLPRHLAQPPSRGSSSAFAPAQARQNGQHAKKRSIGTQAGWAV